MADIPRVKGNIAKMIAQGAPEADIDAYISGEGVSLEQLRGSAKPADKYQTAAIEERDATFPKQRGLSDLVTGSEGARPTGDAGFARRFIHGLTLGADDEILAAASTPFEMIKRGTFNPAEGYRYAKAREDLIMDDSRKNTGVLGTVAEMAGGVGTGINAARSGLTFARNLAPNAGLAARSAAAAGDGAGFGFLSGAAEGNSLSERAGNAALGGAAGGLLGGALPGAMALGGQVAAPFVSNISARINPEGYATRQLARALSESGRTVQQVAGDVSTAAGEGQGMFTVADALGNPGQRLLSSVTRAPGAGRTEAVEFLERRQGGQGRRISNALTEGFDSPQTAEQLRAAMTSARDTAADAAYGAVRKDAGPVDVSGVIKNIDQTINPSGILSEVPQTQGILSANPAPSQASPAFSGGGGILDPHFVSVPGGSQVSVVPKVVEASSLKTSSDPGYKAGLQPRDRSRAASDGQVRDISRNLNPERLGRSAEADRGAPIVGPDFMVESGNGRVAAIRQAYSEGGQSADNYRKYLAAQGVDVSQYREPVLIRERATPMNEAERQAFTVGANQGSTLTMSAPERALADARLISPDALATIKNPADLASVENREFVRQFAARLPQTEQGSFVNAQGHLSSEGATRVRNAVLAKAYGDSPVLTRVAESTNDDIKSISNALTATAPEWAAVREGVASGAIPAEMDITADLLDAVARTARLRSRGGLLSEGLSQADAFNKQSPASEQIMRLFYDADGKRAASSAQITQALRHYAQEAAKAEASPGLMMGLPPVSPSDILGLSAAKVSAPKEISPGLLAAAEKAASTMQAAPAREGAGLAPDSAAAALKSFRDRMTDGQVKVQDFNTVQRLRGDLADAVEGARRAGQGNRARLLGGALRELDTAMETASGGFKQANANFRQASQDIDAIDLGRTAATRGRTEDTIPAFQGLRPQGQQAFRTGYADPLIQQTQGAAFGANKARPLINDAFADEAAAIAPGNPLMQRRIGRENTMFETRNHALGGSRTADNLADSGALGIDPSIVTNLLTGNFAGAARSLLSAGSNLLTGNTAEVREALARMLLERGQARGVQNALTQAQALINRTHQTMQLLSRGAMGGAATVPSQRQ